MKAFVGLIMEINNSLFFVFFPRSPEFNDFLRKALDKNVDNRWSSVQLIQASFLPLFIHCSFVPLFAPCHWIRY